MVCRLISFPNQDAPCILVLTKRTKSWPFGTFVLCTVMIFLPEQHQSSSECRYLRRQGSALCRVAKKHQKRTFLPLFRCCLFCLRQWEGEKKNQVKNKAVPRLSQRKSSRHSEPAGAKLQLHPRGNSRGAPRVLPPARGTASTGWEGARGHRVWAVHGVWGHPI